MTLIAAMQEPLVREMRVGLERKYRVSVQQEAGDQYGYRLKVLVVKPESAKLGAAPKLPQTPAIPPGELHLELRLTDYRATTVGQTVSSPFIGGGEMTVEPTGLPKGLNVTGPQGPVWLPLLSFYFPAGEGAFEIARIPVGGGLEMTGKGTLSKAKGAAQVEIAASFVAGDRTIGKLTISTRLDGSNWPDKASGTFVSEDGTYHFTLARG